TSLAYRGEVGLKLGRLWATGGLMSLDKTLIPAPIAYDTLYQNAQVGSRQAIFATLHGPFWKAIGVDVVAMKWSTGDTSAYVPQYQVQSSIYASTSWLSRFPQRNFHVLAKVSHEYRTEVPFVTKAGLELTNQYRIISTLFELRLYDAVISWQYRNI